MNKTKLLVCLGVFSLLLTGCVNGNNSSSSDEKDAKTITIYAGGSSEYAWKKGALESEVYKAVEDAYYEETGISLKFNVEFLGQNMKNSITTGITGGNIDVVISHMGGGDGIDDWIMLNGLYRDLTNDFEDYEELGSHMTWSDGDSLELNALNRVMTDRGETIAIPSVINPYKFGILVRKDWMEACGYSDVEKEGYTLVDNYETFEEMCLAMKEKYNLSYTISGAIYEIEKAGILGAYDVPAGYYTSSERVYNNNNICDIGGIIDPNYADVLETESRWIQNGILPKSPDDKKVADCELDFIAEKTGVFLENPEITHLIQVARMCKSENPDAEFTVLQAMSKDKESTSKGFMRNSIATFGAVITKNSKNYKEILSFLNWVYSSKENYDLCRYGVKGVHYFEEDGKYTFPEGYSLQNKPYSGILTLVENQSISNMTYGGYTDEELKWIENANKKENYLVNDKVDYMLILKDRTLLNKHFSERKAMYNFTQNIWAGNYTFVKDQGHVDGKSYNNDDRNSIMNTYLANTLEYSIAVYNLYNVLKNTKV